MRSRGLHLQMVVSCHVCWELNSVVTASGVADTLSAVLCHMPDCLSELAFCIAPEVLAVLGDESPVIPLLMEG